MNVDDKIFFGVVFYLFFVGVFSGLLPDDFYSGTHSDLISNSELQETIAEGNQNLDDVDEQLTFWSKLGRFIFITFTLAGVPLIVSLILMFINYFCLLITAVYIYDKLRGI